MDNSKSSYLSSLNRKKLVRNGVVIVLTLVILAVINLEKFFPNKRDSIKEPNLIIICIDSLRADHLGCYGYSRNTSPNIDSLAKEGILFENAYSNSSFTRESVSVILSGLLPSSSGSMGWFAKPESGAKGIGEIFNNAGYRTAFLSASNTLRFKPFTKGFEVISHHSEVKLSGNGPNLSARAADFITKNKDGKFMMYLHYLDPHGPYEPPDDFIKRFTQEIYPQPVGIYTYVRPNCQKLIDEGFGPGDPRFEDIVVRYDAEIAHTDYSIGILLDKLKELDILDNTFIVITADHGEEFLEHNFVEHAWTLYNESTHIPLIFWGNPILQPRRITQRVSSVYITPTILSMLRIPNDRKDFDAHPLFSIQGDSLPFTPPAKPYIGELLIQHRNILRAVVKDNWKYIAAIKWANPENRPPLVDHDITAFEKNTTLHVDTWNPVIREELYNLSDDPGEHSNLIENQPGKRDELRTILLQYESRCKAKHAGKSKKTTDDGPLSEEDKKKLKTLGYL